MVSGRGHEFSAAIAAYCIMINMNQECKLMVQGKKKERKCLVLKLSRWIGILSKRTLTQGQFTHFQRRRQSLWVQMFIG